MLLAYAQLTAGVDVNRPAAERTTLEDAERTLERSVAETTRALANETDPGSHRTVAQLATERLAPAIAAVESSGTNRGMVVDVARNGTAARTWATRACPRGPARAFGDCVTTDGVVTQTRANTTALVAVAVDVTVRGPDGTVTATVVIRGVRGVVVAPRTD
jgi:hypothetical protein